MSPLFIILVGLTISWYSDKMPIFYRCILGPTWSKNLERYLRYGALYDIKGSTQEDCYYDEQLANNIQLHTPLDLTCSCTELCLEKDYKGTVYIRTVSIFSLHAVSDYKKRWSEVSAGVS